MSYNNWASVLAYTGSETFDTLVGSSLDSLLTEKGFSTAGGPNQYQHVAEDKAKSVQGGLVSQYWLVGVYNAAFAKSIGVDPLATWSESFKLSNVTFTIDNTVSEVPLPAAAWLFLTGLAGMSWMKKRKQKRILALQVS